MELLRTVAEVRSALARAPRPGGFVPTMVAFHAGHVYLFDAAMAADAGVDVLFAPGPKEMYPDGFETWIDLERLGSSLEGASRPGHFRGVATVCLKLFNIVQPDAVYFGQKDAQQVEVIRRMLRDLNVPIRLSVQPTLRDPDGLAMSSRNVRLSPAARDQALALPRAL